MAISVDVHGVLLALVAPALAPRGAHLGDHHRALLHAARIDARFGQVGGQIGERAKARGARKARLVLQLLFALRFQLVAERNLRRCRFTLIVRIKL